MAIDPTSPFTGGAILGDRIRMNRHATDELIYIIRSLEDAALWAACHVSTSDVLGWMRLYDV